MGFGDALLAGPAADGGLLVPERTPDLSGLLDEWRGLGYQELAVRVLRTFVDLPEAELQRMLQRVCAVFDDPAVTPVVPVGGLWVAELFHGPTLAFKDLALQFLGNAFEYVLGARDERLNLLAATSGDTGSAAIHAVRGRDRMRVFVLHPRGRISPVQELQMTTVLEDNVFNLAVNGTFDDCQRIVRALFADRAFRHRCELGAVNSINWARIAAQIVYYFYAAFRVMERTGADRVRFAVPTGNFGDLFAGYMAARMGLPVDRLIVATNENDILARFFTTGIYRRGDVRQTVSPAMDIQAAANFERYLYYRLGRDTERVARLMREFAEGGQIRLAEWTAGSVDPLISAGRGTTPDALATIRRYYEREGYLMDPHTAVGVHVAEQHLCDSAPMICLSTAHPAKFGEAIRRAIGSDPAPHPVLDGLDRLPARSDVIDPSIAAVRAYVEERVRGQA